MKYEAAKAKAKAAFQKLRRIEEADDQGICRCVNGEYRHWDKCDGGHFIPAERLATCFENMNVHPQAKSSNQRMHNPIINNGYREYMNKRYGKDEVEKLELRSHRNAKYSTFELIEMAAEYEKKIKKLLRDKKI